jgi:tetratricopeptide (TPR) repeat protein
VEALLKAHDDSCELPAAEPEPTGTYSEIAQTPRGSVPALQPGQLFAGRYKLREKLGEGGMGVVFVADQTEPVQRRVALKIIRAGLDTQRLLARFEQERQALALMDHPNIAKVFDAGMDEVQRPYFAMELVKGLPLTKYCDDARLSPRQRLELFIPVCQAVQHAHQKGIIHRDLKPSNILVGLYDGRPVPKVIDFGVAKATGPRLTEQSIYTEVGSIIGTLEYMSPEQAELNNLDIDTRSDIYALGVILYELLTGGVPFSRKELEKAGLAEMLRVIKEIEPPKPSTKLSHSGTLPSIAAQRQTEPRKLTALVRGELDWIVMKCLEKERGRRYETANGLARDVERYLADEVVEARRPSVGYRLRKFVRRNKGRVLAATALVLTLLAGVAAVLTVEAQAERERAAEAADRAVREAGTTASVDAALRDARERVAEAWDLHDFPDRMQQATDAAVAAIRRADGFVAGGSPTEAARTALADARREVDELARHTRLITTAAANQRKFAEDLNTHGEFNPRALLANRQREAVREFGLDPVRGEVDEVAGAIAASRLRDAILGILLEWHVHAEATWKLRQTAPDLVPDDPAADPAVKDGLIRVVGAARRRCGGAYARWQDLLDKTDVPGLVEFATSPEGLSFRAGLVNALARDLTRARQYSACRTLLRAAADRYPHDVWLHYDLYLNCISLQPQDWAEALRHIAAASAQWPDCWLFHVHLAECYAALGAHEQAVAAHRKAIALSVNASDAYLSLAKTLQKKQDLDGAIAVLQEAMRADPKTAYLHIYLGLVLLDKKDREGADAAFREAARRTPKSAAAHYVLGMVYMDAKVWDRAITAFRDAVRLQPDHPKAEFQLGLALLQKNDPDGAIAAYREVVRLEPKNAIAYAYLGFALQQQKEWGPAITALREAVRLDPNQQWAHVNLGIALKLADRHAEALQVTLAVLRQNPAWGDDPRTAVRNNAACYSLCCSDGKGANAPPPAERPAYRKQALDLLTADLAALRKLAATDAALVHARMELWLTHEDSLCVRDPAALKRLSPEERDAWTKLFAEFRDLGDRTAPPSRTPKDVK